MIETHLASQDKISLLEDFRYPYSLSPETPWSTVSTLQAIKENDDVCFFSSPGCTLGALGDSSAAKRAFYDTIDQDQGHCEVCSCVANSSIGILPSMGKDTGRVEVTLLISSRLNFIYLVSEISANRSPIIRIVSYASI